MGKTVMMTIRVEPDVRKRIQDAAKRVHKSVSTFVLESALIAAAKVETKPKPVAPPSDDRSANVPIFFRMLCATAEEGGERGYDWVGQELAEIVKAWTDDDGGAWARQVRQLAQFARAKDVDGVLGWFDHWFDKWMELVPARRRERFAEGILRFEAETGFLGR